MHIPVHFVGLLSPSANAPAGNGKIHKADSLPKLLQDKPLRMQAACSFVVVIRV